MKFIKILPLGLHAIREGSKIVREARYCSNGHPILPGDRVRFHIGINDSQFDVFEECVECVRRGWAVGFLDKYPDPYRKGDP